MNSEQQERARHQAVYDDTRTIANFYAHSVQLQIQRVLEDVLREDPFTMRQFIDFEFLLVALVRIRRCATAIAEIPKLTVHMNAAIKCFDSRLPMLADIRNITEHVDDYIWVRGRKKSLNTQTSRSGLLTKAFSHNEFEWMGFKIEFHECMNAASELFQAIKAAREVMRH